MRDDFPAKAREALAKRAAYKCSNPGCRALTIGPQHQAEGAVSIGRAAHITAASPGGPRYDPSLTPRQRSGQANGVWLCANCADKVDKDETAYTVGVLREWKKGADAEARQHLGRSKAPATDPFRVRERQIKRDHRLRDELKAALLKQYEDRPHEGRPYAKFNTSKMIVHSLDDTTYPGPDADPPAGRLSGWFRVVPYDFYHGGLLTLV